MSGKSKGIAAPLLAWFEANRRSLPFREDPTPYHIWVSEIMLQQTRMTTVLPYYERFIRRYPDPAALAASGPEELHKLWEGLGYYSRADNLRRAAEVIVREHSGELPRTAAELRTLPGIGDYTAGAIASISCGERAAAVDGNVLRVFSRLWNDRADITSPDTKARVTERVLAEQPPDRPGDFNQALMELGALVCTPGEPTCESCPLADLCEAHLAGCAALLPVKRPPRPRRQEDVTVLILHSEDGVLLQKRPPSGLLKGLWQPVTLPGRLGRDEAASAFRALVPGAEIVLNESLPYAKHVFSHVEWTLGGWRGTFSAVTLPDGFAWSRDPDADGYAVPNAFKAYKHFLAVTDE